MSKLFYLSCLLLLTSIKSVAQQRAPINETYEPIKNKSNRIILHFRDTAGLFTQFAKLLIDRGYEIEEKDRELGTLKTMPSPAPGGYSHKHQIKAVYRDSTIVISGASFSGGYKFDTYYTAKNRKNIIDLSWQEMIKVGEMLRPVSVTYSIQ